MPMKLIYNVNRRLLLYYVVKSGIFSIQFQYESEDFVDNPVYNTHISKGLKS